MPGNQTHDRPSSVLPPRISPLSPYNTPRSKATRRCYWCWVVLVCILPCRTIIAQLPAPVLIRGAMWLGETIIDYMLGKAIDKVTDQDIESQLRAEAVRLVATLRNGANSDTLAQRQLAITRSQLDSVSRLLAGKASLDDLKRMRAELDQHLAVIDATVQRHEQRIEELDRRVAGLRDELRYVHEQMDVFAKSGMPLPTPDEQEADPRPHSDGRKLAEAYRQAPRRRLGACEPVSGAQPLTASRVWMALGGGNAVALSPAGAVFVRSTNGRSRSRRVGMLLEFRDVREAPPSLWRPLPGTSLQVCTDAAGDIFVAPTE